MKHITSLVLALAVVGCTGLPPTEMRERPLIAAWTVPTAPQVTARCIARDIETELQAYGYRAAVHPGLIPNTYEVFGFEHQDWVIQSFEALRVLFTVEPEVGGGSKIFYRHSFYTARTADRAPRFGVKNCW